MRLALVVLVSLAIAACGRYALVATGPTTLDGVLRVQPSIEWNRVANTGVGDIGATEVWTLDGEELQSLIFMLNVRDGESLLSPPGKRREKLPKFRSSMSLDELAGLFEATVTRLSNSSVFEFRSIAPSTVFGHPGLRMEFAFVDADSIDRDGVAVAVVHDGKLFVISYQGTRLYHFEKYRSEVEGILSTAQFVAKG
jgi:hypothetical protein